MLPLLDLVFVLFGQAVDVAVHGVEAMVLLPVHASSGEAVAWATETFRGSDF
jgi:hypothetical protein